MSRILRARLSPITLAALCAAATLRAAATGPADPAGTRLAGLRLGPHAVGFEVSTGVDGSRRINALDEGTQVGLATWYPAQPGGDLRRAMSTLDYRLLEFSRPLSDAARRSYEEAEAAALRAWRHIGIVDMTPEQATASLHTRGVAIRGASRASGRFPVVVVLGGRYYLSTTAEFLASHGFLVVAPFRFLDQSNEVGTNTFAWYQENSVRDAEWALERLRADPSADLTSVSTVGHGGGGVGAMLFAMRHRNVSALVNIDASILSAQSRPREHTSYSPRVLRAPFLYVATANTRKTQDLFEDFLSMRFSQRYEVILNTPDLRHHDLSDLGRGVTAPMSIRGAAAADVQRDYAHVHETIVRFLRAHRTGRTPDPSFSDWLKSSAAASGHSVVTHAAVAPAPTTVAVIESLGRDTVTALRDARQRDPDAPVFQLDSLARSVTAAADDHDLATAAAMAAFAVELHPEAPVLVELQSRIDEARGDLPRALQRATVCAGLPTASSWRASVAVSACRDRVQRLTRRGIE